MRTVNVPQSMAMYRYLENYTDAYKVCMHVVCVHVVSVCVKMHAYVCDKHTYIHRYIHIHAYIHTYAQVACMGVTDADWTALTYQFIYIHTYIHTCMHAYIHTYIHMLRWRAWV